MPVGVAHKSRLSGQPEDRNPSEGSRRILSSTLKERLGSGGTCRVLLEAIAQLNDCPNRPIVVADSGSENVNGAVDRLLDGEDLSRVLAQIEVTFSTSMIEAFWRSLTYVCSASIRW